MFLSLVLFIFTVAKQREAFPAFSMVAVFINKHFVMKRTILLSLLQSLLLLLFAYTAVSKFLDLAAFEAVLRRTPFISRGAATLAPATPLAELALVLLLLFPRTRHWGFVGSAVLLLVFALYLTAMLLSGAKLPCSCGGVVAGMSWGAHLGMNVGLIGLAILGVRSHRTERTLYDR